METVLIIGGNRHVGKFVSELLDKERFDITVMNRKGTGSNSVKKIKCDRDNKLEFKNVLSDNYDIILDMCCYNLKQIKTLEELLDEYPNQYIFISSLATQQSDLSEYGFNKLRVEDYLKYKSDLAYVILRPGYIVGPEDPYKRIQYYINLVFDETPIHIKNNYPIIISNYYLVVEEILDFIYSRIVNVEFNMNGLLTNPKEIIEIIKQLKIKKVKKTNTNNKLFEMPIMSKLKIYNNKLRYYELKSLIKFIVNAD